ncbi:MAG TPA: DUF6624 domain-containing protein [Gaiella sp.]|uniref:DUF6624 domain-containing protein n=1 Tax=Gaiella sp. TaxID=2663207 RepID=UPI002D7EBC04|nr:DUF6624 domain-containing protein [Gaiella sp.]HET9288979.1 DUF6624 domain-containing protein [Gaiella sp.]
MNTELAAELARMADEDQRVRRALPSDASSPSAFDWPRAMEMARVDVENTDRLREIVDEHGWPGRSLVGEEGAEHAWLLAQHASTRLDFQRRVLDLLTAAVAAGEATPRQLAYLTDRVRMSEGKNQIYGTQYIRDEHDHRVPYPIEDGVHVDARRAGVGLAPLGECP